MTGDTTSTLDAFLTQAARDHPARPAVTDTRITLTYADLDQAVGALATDLTGAGLRPGDRVGILLERSIAATCAIYAVLRAGGVAAPLEVSNPARLTHRLARQAGLRFILTQPEAATTISDENSHPQLTVSGLVLVTAGAPQRQDTDGGYVLFTSGSTGTPKGVRLSHGNIRHFVEWAVTELDIGCHDRIGAQSALTFDLSTFDIFGAAAAGACLCLMPEEHKLFPSDLVAWLHREHITVFYAVPTLWMAAFDRGGLSTAPPEELRVIAFAGEPFPPVGLRRLLDLLPGRAFYNLYGPTETNVCTYERLAPDWDPAAGLAIGTPISGIQVRLLDEEIAVSGPTVFQGYIEDGIVRDPTITLDTDQGETTRAYLTGDLASIGTDGRLYLRGRRDQQVKRRGHRIELAAIENLAHQIPGVLSCAAVWLPDRSAHGEIWLFAVSDTADEHEILHALAERSARSALPDRIKTVPALPTNARGKIDRDALAHLSHRQGAHP